MSKEINAQYVNGDSVQAVLSAMKKQPPARSDKAKFELKWLLAGAAGLLFLAAYLPKHPIKETKSIWKQWLMRKKRQSSAASA